MKRTHLVIAFALTGLWCQEALSQSCRETFLLANTIEVLDLREIVEKGADFSIHDFPNGSSYTSTGCGVACALNLVQAVHRSLGFSWQSRVEQFAEIRPHSDPFFTTSTFGTHGASSLVGLNVGTLSQVLRGVLDHKLPPDRLVVEAFQRSAHQDVLGHDKSIQFPSNMQTVDPFSVSARESKILLVEVSQAWGSQKSYLSTHFYNVISFREGILTLYDPLTRGRLIEFEVRPHVEEGNPTYALVPVSQGYEFASYPAGGLHFMLNGFVRIQIGSH